MLEHVEKTFKAPIMAAALTPLKLLPLFLLLSLCSCSLPKDYTPDNASYGTSQGVAMAARSQIGVRYKYGAMNPGSSFDCSGLVCWAHRAHGIKIPRTTTEQLKVGRAVPPNQMRPGDIVLFRISRKGGYHSGIYAGNGNFIHSPSSGKTVREESMGGPYWSPRFIGSRRPRELE